MIKNFFFVLQYILYFFETSAESDMTTLPYFCIRRFLMGEKNEM